MIHAFLVVLRLCHLLWLWAESRGREHPDTSLDSMKGKQEEYLSDTLMRLEPSFYCVSSCYIVKLMLFFELNINIIMLSNGQAFTRSP